MTDHDMRALALNLAHTSERFPADVLSRARAYYGFLSRSEETSKYTQTIAQAMGGANALNPYATSYHTQG